MNSARKRGGLLRPENQTGRINSMTCLSERQIAVDAGGLGWAVDIRSSTIDAAGRRRRFPIVGERQTRCRRRRRGSARSTTHRCRVKRQTAAGFPSYAGFQNLGLSAGALLSGLRVLRRSACCRASVHRRHNDARVFFDAATRTSGGLHTSYNTWNINYFCYDKTKFLHLAKEWTFIAW